MRENDKIVILYWKPHGTRPFSITFTGVKASDSQKTGFAASILKFMQQAACFPRSMQGRSLLAHLFLISALAAGLCLSATAQAPAMQMDPGRLPDAPQPQLAGGSSAYDPNDVTVHNSARIFLHDEEGIWTSPARLRPHDLVWLAPLGAATGAAFATDHRAQSQLVSHDPNFNNANITTSDVLIGGMLAAPVALFAAGDVKHDEHARETGILSSEAAVDGFVVCQVFKLATWRERPDVDQARGHFFQSGAGIDGSFFSMHTTLAFAVASSIAEEYHSPWTQIAAYTGASAVGVTRVLGRQHFPSDVLVAATTGWLIGHYVVKHHHRKAAGNH